MGNGHEKVLAFHGFGQSAEQFREYLEPLAEQYELYIFDHFFHGQSEWKPITPIKAERFAALIEEFLSRENIKNFHILAYSLGGKWAHSIVRFHAERVKKVLLFAPDGARTTLYYSFSSRHPVGRWSFKKTVQHPRTFFWLLRTFYRLGILSKSLYRFVYLQMGSSVKRNQVYETWTKYRDFKGLSPLSIRVYNEKQIPLRVVVGSYDRVIKPEWFAVFKAKIKLFDLVEVKKGHRSILYSIVHEARKFF